MKYHIWMSDSKQVPTSSRYPSGKEACELSFELELSKDGSCLPASVSLLKTTFALAGHHSGLNCRRKKTLKFHSTKVSLEMPRVVEKMCKGFARGSGPAGRGPASTQGGGFQKVLIVPLGNFHRCANNTICMRASTLHRNSEEIIWLKLYSKELGPPVSDK